jgi:large subunit ribosomal protein L29
MSKTKEALKKFRDMSSEELNASLATSRDELFRLRLGMHTNQVVSTAALGNKRREVARIITVLKAKA